MASVAPKPYVLLAAQPEALDRLCDVLGPTLTALPAASVEKATAILQSRPDVRLILCTMHFDGTGTFQLLRVARREYTDIPFVCCCAGQSRVRKMSTDPERTAHTALGATAFVDIPELARQCGAEGVAQYFHELIRNSGP